MSRLRASLLNHFEEIVAGAALIVVIVSVAWGVITRYITEQPATWAGELAVIAFAWVVFLGASACFKYRLHASIDMVTALLPDAARKAVRGLVHALVLGFCLFMTWYGVLFSIEEWDNPTSVLRWPLTVLYGPVTLGFALMIVRYVQHLYAPADAPAPVQMS